MPAEGASCTLEPGRCSAATAWWATFDYGKATPFAINIFHAGGSGARTGQGRPQSATAFPSGVRNTPVEINETIAPLLFWKKEYREDSGGPGLHRGGTGQVMEISHAEDAPFAVSPMFDRLEFPPRGRNGGKAGQCGRLYLASGKELRGKGTATGAGRRPLGDGNARRRRLWRSLGAGPSAGRRRRAQRPCLGCRCRE